jgi:hypothetical protein
MLPKWLAKQAIIGAIAAQCASYPAAAQSGPITVTSNDAKCGYEAGPGNHFKFRCDGNALIADTDKDQFIACNYTVYSEYEPKVGGGGPPRYVISSILSPSGGFCYIQQAGPDYSPGSVFALDSQKTPTNDGNRAHLLLIYDGPRLEACMTPNWTAMSSKTIAETTCVGLRIVGNFR